MDLRRGGTTGQEPEDELGRAIGISEDFRRVGASPYEGIGRVCVVVMKLINFGTRNRKDRRAGTLP